MATALTFYSQSFRNQIFGLVTGTNTQTAVSFPSEPVGAVNIQSYADNDDAFFIGTTNHVWWELAPNEETGWFHVENLNELQFYSVSGSAERLSYWIMR